MTTPHKAVIGGGINKNVCMSQECFGQQLHKRRHFAALCFCQEEPCLGLLELYVLLCDEGSWQSAHEVCVSVLTVLPVLVGCG